jgi:hypothetical protein
MAYEDQDPCPDPEDPRETIQTTILKRVIMPKANNATVRAGAFIPFRLDTETVEGWVCKTDRIELYVDGAWSDEFAVSPSLSLAIHNHLLVVEPKAASKLEEESNHVVGVLTLDQPDDDLPYIKFKRIDDEAWESAEHPHMYICKPVLERLGIDDGEADAAEMFIRLKIVPEAEAQDWHKLVEAGDRA